MKYIYDFIFNLIVYFCFNQGINQTISVDEMYFIYPSPAHLYNIINQSMYFIYPSPTHLYNIINQSFLLCSAAIN